MTKKPRIVGSVLAARALRIISALSRPRIRNRILLLAAVLIFVGFVVSLAIAGLGYAIFFDGYAANGAFQLLNPLRRLAAGEVLGQDFNFFHGVGVPLIHLPFYYLFGQGFMASELARWLVSPMLFVVSSFVFFYCLRRRFVFAVTMTALATMITMWLVPFLITPATSLLGVRSVLPVFLMAVLIKQADLRRRYRWLPFFDLYEVLVAGLLALGVICGTEFGVAAIVAFAIVNILYRSQAMESWKSRLLATGRIVGLGLVLTLVALTVITRGAPFTPLKYAFLEVPADQFWYFGVPPNVYLTFQNWFSTLMGDGRFEAVAAVTLAAALLVFWLHRLKAYRDISRALAFGLLAGSFSLVSMLGYYAHAQTAALARMAVLAGLAAIVLLYCRWRRPLFISFQAGKGKKRQTLPITPAGVLALMAVLLIPLAIHDSIAAVRQSADQNHGRSVIARLKQHILGRDTGLLGDDWHSVDSAVMPIIQADNSVEVNDMNEDGYVHGIKAEQRQIVITSSSHDEFIKPGQIVYLNKAGRQIVKQVEQITGKRLVVTLENPDLRLDPQHDGAPSKVVVAEDFDRNSKQVWSLYTGLLDQEMKTFHPSSQGYDYIIHALGQERRQEYVDDFKQTKPDFVLTLTRPYFRYEEWMQSAHWDFYSLLDENYQVVKQTEIYNVWKRRDQGWSDAHRQNQDWQQLSVDQADRKISLPALSFDNVPDIEALGREQQQRERDRERELGLDSRAKLKIGAEEYDAYKLNEIRAEREYLLSRRENSGAETDEKEDQDWLDAVHADRNPSGLAAPKGKFDIERPKRQVILVKLQYKASHDFEKLPLLGKTTRYMVEPNNTYWGTDVSLRPYGNEVIFPLVISEYNKDSYLRLNTYSMLPGEGELQITKAEWLPLETTPENLQALTD